MSFVCEICKKSFVRKAHLKRHLFTHGGEKNHECKVCNKLFFRKENLKKHSLIHNAERSHVCHICDRKFSRKQSLKEHLLVHKGESPYVCGVCNRTFSQSGHLKNHVLIHMGEKPHLCSVCNKAFTEKGTMRRHMLTHSGEKSHVCIICNKSFSRKDFLRRHALLHCGRTPEKKVKKVAFSILREERCNLCSFCKKVFSENVCAKLQFSEQRQKTTYACDNCLEHFVKVDDFKVKTGISCSTNDATISTNVNESGLENCHPEDSKVKDNMIYIVMEEHDIKSEGFECFESLEKIDKKMDEKITFDNVEPDCVSKKDLSLERKEFAYDIKREKIDTYEADGDIKEKYCIYSEEGSRVLKGSCNIDRKGDNDVKIKGQLNNKESDGKFKISFIDIKEEPLLECQGNMN